MNFKAIFLIAIIAFSSIGFVAAGEGTIWFKADADSYDIWLFGHHRTHVKDQEWDIYTVLEDGSEQLLMRKFRAGLDECYPDWYNIGEFKATAKLRFEYYFYTQNAFSNSWDYHNVSCEQITDGSGLVDWCETYVYFNWLTGKFSKVICAIQ
ncbi:MAG: hypothetical protein CfClM3_0407 [Methanobrevibacter sp. CfCl-M3]